MVVADIKMELPWHVSGNLEILIPSNLFEYAEKQRSSYAANLRSYLANEDQPILPIEFCTGLVSHVAGQVRTDYGNELIHLIWDHLETQVLRDVDIHGLAATLTSDNTIRQRIIRTYFSASLAAGVARQPRGLALRAVPGAKPTVYGIFGGQGITRRYFDEIRSVVATYRPLINDLLDLLSRNLLDLSRDVRVSAQYEEELHVMQWLLKPESTPSEDYLLGAPVSFPLIGLLQLLYVKAILMSLNLTPAELPAAFRGFTGHSQGIVVACAVATTSNWQEFHEAALKAVTILFWIGARCQQVFSPEYVSSHFDMP